MTVGWILLMPRSQISGASMIFRGKPTAGSLRPAKCHRTVIPNICARSHNTAGTVLDEFETHTKKRCRKMFARQHWDESRITVESYRRCKEIARWSLHRADIARVQHIHRKKYRARPSRYWQHSYIHRALLPHFAAIWWSLKPCRQPCLHDVRIILRFPCNACTIQQLSCFRTNIVRCLHQTGTISARRHLSTRQPCDACDFKKMFLTPRWTVCGRRRSSNYRSCCLAAP